MKRLRRSIAILLSQFVAFIYPPQKALKDMMERALKLQLRIQEQKELMKQVGGIFEEKPKQKEMLS